VSGALRVAVVGAPGRLGRFACELLERSAGFELVARVGRGDDLERAVRDAGAAVAFESTRAGLGAANALVLLRAGVRPLVATSGVSADEARELDRAARELGLGGLVAPNLSRGMWLLQRAAEEAARHVARCEVIELHHDKKRDAPSGTALDTVRRLRAARGGGEDVPIHSVRLPGLAAHQEVVFGAPGEVYTLRHDAFSPEAYAPGILAGLRHVASATGVAVGIGHAFERAG
jgi:4-hydroxy-tetrahydrodipicolinate reductase